MSNHYTNWLAMREYKRYREEEHRRNTELLEQYQAVTAPGSDLQVFDFLLTDADRIMAHGLGLAL